MSNYHIYMPNEIFPDLANNIETHKHVSFAYAYYYYISYLYRYCKFSEDIKITQAEIKKSLGYSPVEKRVDYIIKKNGMLDEMGYTLTTDDYPLSWEIDDDSFLNFNTIEQYRNEYGKSAITQNRNFKIKYPIKCFHRTGDTYNEKYLDGTFYDVANTHKIQYSTFSQMMENDSELGVSAFYIYAYLKWKTDMFGNYRASARGLVEQFKISSETLYKYMYGLEKYNFVEVQHKKFIGIDGEANLYRTLK